MLDAELNKKVVLKTQLKQDISCIYKNRESKAAYFLPLPSKKLTTETLYYDFTKSAVLHKF